VVGVDVGVEDVGDLPAALLGEAFVPRVHPRVHGSVDDSGLILRADQIRQATLAGAPDLHDLRFAPFQRDVSGVPGETPGLHAALQGENLVTPPAQLLGGERAGSAAAADGHNGRALGTLE
jgi:hypothetical protein